MRYLLPVFMMLFAGAVFASDPGQNFRPCQTFTVTASTTSASTAIAACGDSTLQLDCYNAGSNMVFLAGTVLSATPALPPTGTPIVNSYHLAPGIEKVFDFGGATYMAYVTATGTSAIYCTSGAGQ